MPSHIHSHLPFLANATPLDQESRAAPRPVATSDAWFPISNPTIPFWAREGDNPLAREGANEPLPDEVDICVIGSGITGVGFAYHLSRLVRENFESGEILKVTIIEARDFCTGATGRNGGHLTPYAIEDFARRSLVYGIDEAIRARNLEHHTVRSILEIIREAGVEADVDLVNGGHGDLLFTEIEQENARADWKAAEAAGIDLSALEWLTAEETQKRYGAAYPSLHSPEGWNLWPLKLVTKLYELAAGAPLSQPISSKSWTSMWPLNRLANLSLSSTANTPASETSDPFSLSLYTHTLVKAIVPLESPASDVGARYTLKTSRGSIQTRYIFHGTNAYVSSLLPHLYGPEGVIPTRGQVLAIEANVPREKLTMSSWSGNEGFEYWFPRPEKAPSPSVEERDGKVTGPLVILGGGREASGSGFEYYTVDDASVNPEVGKALRRFLPEVFPGMYAKGREPLMEWTGIMGYTQTGDPMVGPVLVPDGMESSTRSALPGQYMSAGYSGHGMPRAFGCAEAVAQMMYEELRVDLGKEHRVWNTPEWFPKSFLTTKVDTHAL